MRPSQGREASSILVPRSRCDRNKQKVIRKLHKIIHMYHGIVLDLEFKDPTFPEKFKVFAKRKSTTNDWILYGVEIPDKEISQSISKIQENMRDDEPYYAHFYSDNEMLVVFKNKIFKVKPHNSTWRPIINHGRSLNIPEEQLGFWPNRFQDEIHYFKQEDYI